MGTIDKRRIAVLDAPSNLGLRPPAKGAVPGVYKLPWALRRHGLIERLGAIDAGAVVPPRYLSQWTPGIVRNEQAIAAYSHALAERLAELRKDGVFPLVLGGDCSIILGNLLALRREGRFGLAYIDGHSDFRHPGNSDRVGAAAGEDLALVTGRGHLLARLKGRKPLIREKDVVAIGMRANDSYVPEMRTAGIKCLMWTICERIPGKPYLRSCGFSNAMDSMASGCTSTWMCSMRKSCRPLTHQTRMA